MSLSFVIIWVEFYHNFILWVLSPFDFLFYFSCYFSFVTVWDFEFCHNLSICVLSQLQFLSFVAIWVKFCHYLSFWFWSQFEFLIFVTISVFEFSHQLGLVAIWVIEFFGENFFFGKNYFLLKKVFWQFFFVNNIC